ncbi:MAG: hypothetical protein U0163_21455, partial [Gemmatimonadaceae bacterium]
EGKKPVPLEAAQLLFSGQQAYTIHVDDSAPPTPPSDWQAAYGYFTAGALQGMYRFTYGTLHGIFVDLPILIGKGVANIPTAWMMYAQYSAEIGRELTENPALAAIPGGVVLAQLKLAYKAAPELLGKATELRKNIDAAIVRKYTGIANEWYAGDWRNALREMTAESVENALNVLDPGVAELAIGCAVSRAPKLLQKVAARVADLQVEVGEKLGPIVRRAVDVEQANAALRRILKPGYEFRNLELRQMFGLSEEQAAYLRKFAEENQVIVTLRSRATESIEWFKKGLATLKPEQIKTKNVNLYDMLYLGYRGDRQGNIGRVAIRKPLFADIKDSNVAAFQFKQFLKSNHKNLSEFEIKEIVERFKDRHKEWWKPTPSDGYAQQLLKWDQEGKITIKWRFDENIMDPSKAPKRSETYDFRMRVVDKAGDGTPLEWIPEVKVDGKWRSFTGDVDLVSITHANGNPLDDVAHIDVFEQFRQDGIMGFMHPESATWFKNGKFTFPDKFKYIVDECCYAQFAPDGVARAVMLEEKMSQLSGPLEYYLHYLGGYLYPYRGPNVARGTTPRLRPTPLTP